MNEKPTTIKGSLDMDAMFANITDEKERQRKEELLRSILEIMHAVDGLLDIKADKSDETLAQVDTVLGQIADAVENITG